MTKLRIDSLGHQDLGPKQTWTDTYEREWELNCILPTTQFLTFYFSDDPYERLKPFRKGLTQGKTDKLDLHIGRKDAWIVIRLSQANVKWTWHRARAITTAVVKDSEYFNLQYYDDSSGKYVDPPYDGATKIRFVAKTRGTGTADKFGFNMNVILAMENSESLPISIDPDIQNPGTHGADEPPA